MSEFKVVSGNPTPEELAVVVAVLQAAVAAGHQAKAGGHLRKTTSTWNRNEGMLRAHLTPGPGQWRASVRSGLN